MNSNGAFSLLIFALPLLLLGWLFYTQNKRMKQVREFSAALNIGDQVVTSSGLFGTIKHLDDTTAWLEVAEGITLRFDRRAVAMRQSDTASTGPTDTTGTTGTTGTNGTTGEAGTDDAPGSSQSGQ